MDGDHTCEYNVASADDTRSAGADTSKSMPPPSKTSRSLTRVWKTCLSVEDDAEDEEAEDDEGEDVEVSRPPV